MPGLILVIDPVAINRVLLRAKVAQSCRAAVPAPDLATGLGLAGGEQPELVILGPGLGADAACETSAAVRAHPACRGVPVLALTERTSRTQRLALLEAGVEDTLDPPGQGPFLLARLRRLLRQRGGLEDLAERPLGLAEPMRPFQRPGHLVLITGTPSTGRAWDAAMGAYLPHRITSLTHGAALSSLPLASDPDVIAIEHGAGPAADSLRLLAELRSRAQTCHAAAILVAAAPEAAAADAHEAQLAMALDIGADDVLRHGFCAAELAMRTARQLGRKRQDDRLRNRVRDGLRQAIRDPLTGLYNRRYALPHLDRLARQSTAAPGQLAVMMLDLDRFKAINDRHGHAAGDAVLVEVATRLGGALGPQDLLARIGGEEFLVALPGTDLITARARARRLCHLIGATPVQIGREGHALSVTVSIGIAMSPATETAPTCNAVHTGQHGAPQVEDGHPATELLARADRALYDAKAGGRNCVTVHRSAA